jgi:hypothetical protein
LLTDGLISHLSESLELDDFGTTMWENTCAACILHDAAIRYLVFVSFDVRDGLVYYSQAPSLLVYDSPMANSLIVLIAALVLELIACFSDYSTRN